MRPIDDAFKKSLLIFLVLLLFFSVPAFVLTFLFSIALLLGVGADVGREESIQYGLGYLFISGCIAIVMTVAGAGAFVLWRSRGRRHEKIEHEASTHHSDNPPEARGSR
ncbi:MAG: hypothetical protein KDA28_13575 [Phycisphaerales bacterium]|nr:hypothetical protein [Phycisphaerales bacterium]